MEEWAGFGRRIEAHLAAIDQEMAALRETLRAAGIPVRRQRIRVTKDNANAGAVLDMLKAASPMGAVLTPTGVSRRLGVSPEYAYDLLASLVAAGKAERVARGEYRYSDPTAGRP